MSRLPVIVGFGGVNSAGRLSCHHGYRRMVIDALGEAEASETYRSLAALMNLDGDPSTAETRQYIRDHTLIRRIEHFDPTEIGWQRAASLIPDTESIRFTLNRRQLPDVLPDNWQLDEAEGDKVRVTVNGKLNVMIPDQRSSKVTSAGQLPTGFEPGTLYQSRNHPRGLQLTVYGASDAVRSLGMDWSVLRDAVRPDQFCVYSGSAMGQLDTNGTGGMMQAGMIGKRVTSKQLPLGLCEMPADFINAYVLGSVGATGATIGACATFLYNMRQGVEDIQSGRRRVAVVGNSEAPITPEVIEGYRTMGALAEDDALMELDGSNAADNRRACRPFAENCGFTLSEAAVYTVLMDDELAVELGAEILGAVPEVYVNSDGFKKSIPGPGVGNYVTVAKAMALTRQLLGDDSLRQRSLMQAHGTGTPQNRVTESQIMNELAKVFGIDRWPVGAIKAYLGHSLAPAGGDQLAAILGTWQYGWIPGITTIERIADDVHRSNLQFEIEHRQIDPGTLDTALINSKGFGGNNATGVVLSPDVTRQMLAKRHGKDAMTEHAKRNEAIRAQIHDYDQRATAGQVATIYQFGEGVLDGDDLTITTSAITIPGYGQTIDLDLANPYPDMT
jgi:acetoacetyl-[acyl-carrier protein] synthase